MGLADKFRMHGILLPNGSWISELTDTTPAANLQHMLGRQAAGVVPDFRGGFGARADISFTTPQVKTVLDACGLFGYDMSAGNCDLYYRAGTNLARDAALASMAHLRIRCVRALLYWTGITARQDGQADIACRIIPTYDGTVVPFVPLDDQAIPSCSLATEFFTLGPIKLNGDAITGLESVGIQLAPTVNVKASDGEAYASWAGVEDHDPIVTAETTALELWDTIGLDGVVLNALLVYLRRLKPDEPGTYADGDAQHICFTGASGMATPESSNNEGLLSLRIGLRRSDCSAAHVMSVNTATAVA